MTQKTNLASYSLEDLRKQIDLQKWVGDGFEFLWDPSIDPLWTILLYSKDAKKTRELQALTIVRMLQYPDLDPIWFKKHENYHFTTTFRALVEMWNLLVKLYPQFKGVFTIKDDSPRTFRFYRQKGNHIQEVQFFSLDNPTKYQGIEPSGNQKFFMICFDEPVDVEDARRNSDHNQQELIIKTLISSIRRHSGNHKPEIYAAMNAFDMNSFWIYHFFIEIAGLIFMNDEYIDYLIENGRWDKYIPEAEGGEGVFVSNGNWRVNEFLDEGRKKMYLSMEEDYFNGISTAALPISIGVPGALDNFPLFDLSNFLVVKEIKPEEVLFWYSTWDYGINDAMVGFLWSINAITYELTLHDFQEFKLTRNATNLKDKLIRERMWAENMIDTIYLWEEKFQQKDFQVFVDSKEGFISTLLSMEKDLMNHKINTLDRLKQLFPIKNRSQIVRESFANKKINIAFNDNTDNLIEIIKYMFDTYQEIQKGNSNNVEVISPVIDRWDAWIYGVIIYYNILNIPVETTDENKEVE